MLRFTLLNVLPRIEPGEMVSDDFVLTVALQAVRSRIPARNTPARIQHENGVVEDTLDQQSEVLRVVPQTLLCGPEHGDCGSRLYAFLSRYRSRATRPIDSI